MGKIGVKNKKEVINNVKWSEELIQRTARRSVLSPSSIKYCIENLYVYKWESDLLLISKSDYAYEVEAKISRSDFKNDFKHKVDKHTLMEEKTSILSSNIDNLGSKLPNYFYYAVPENLIAVEEVPEYAGLIYVSPTVENPDVDNDWYWKARVIKEAPLIHKDKFSISLQDKFYYAYRNWKDRYFNDLRQYRMDIEHYKTVDGKTYKMHPDEMEKEIEYLKDAIKIKEKVLDEGYDNLKVLITENRKLKRLLKENNIETNKEESYVEQAN